jgi:neutral ceramidase
MRRVASVALCWLSLLSAGWTAEAQDLRAAVASVDITPPVGVPLAGYSARRLPVRRLFARHRHATYFEPSTGTRDPIAARVLLLQRDQKRLLFIAVDLIGSDRRMRSDLIKRLRPLGFGEDDVFLSASHSHSGPGTFAKNWVWELAASDVYMRSVYRGIVDRVVTAVEQANQSLAPAALWSYGFDATNLQRNRRGQLGHYDRAANVLLVKTPDGAWMGGIVNLAIHGTVLTAENLRYSADVTGGMQRALEASLASVNPPGSAPPIVLYVNGAEGDVGPALEEESGIDTIGATFAMQAMAAISTAAPVAPEWSIARTRVSLGRARFNLRACMDVPTIVRWLVGIPNIAIGSAFPRSTDIWAIKLGNHVMFTWPGEPNTTLGLELKAVGASAGAARTWVLGLTNDHLSYFVDPATYSGRTYEACSSLYRADGGAKIVDGFRSIIGTP